MDFLGHQHVAQIGAERVRRPAQRVHHAVVGNPERVSDHAVFARAPAGAHRRQPRRGGGGVADAQIPAAKSCQYRRVVGVGVEQLCAETVDQ